MCFLVMVVFTARLTHMLVFEKDGLYDMLREISAQSHWFVYLQKLF